MEMDRVHRNPAGHHYDRQRCEDTHVWIVEAAGSHRRELTAEQDRRARSPRWSRDSKTVIFLAGNRGLIRFTALPCPAQAPTVSGLFLLLLSPRLRTSGGNYVTPGSPNVFQVSNIQRPIQPRHRFLLSRLPIRCTRLKSGWVCQVVTKPF